MTENEQRVAAKAFADKWQGKGYEKGETQKFWLELISTVYGVKEPVDYMNFEVQIQLSNVSFIDVYIPSTKVIIEQKSIGKDLTKGIKQSDGTWLTPMQQMIRYANAMNYDEMPRWGISCNFQEFMIFDFNNKHSEPERIKLADLPNEFHRLDFLVAKENVHIRKEVEISVEAGKLVGRIYDYIAARYNSLTPEVLQSLNKLCVRLIFCMYAEDAGIFQHNQFYNYMKNFPVKFFRTSLVELFHVLNTPLSERDEYLDDELAAFPYVNGGLFDGDIEIPKFDERTVEVILEEASLSFSWRDISPTIFGAVFESTLSAKTRRSGGMHYTSIENIHKVIDPLFLDDLAEELEAILAIPQVKQRNSKLADYQDKLASLTFFDPACGSGNFLTETYIALRRLENRAIQAMLGEQIVLGDIANPIKVSIHQFYGIEINDFAVSVAKTALWIAEYQMMVETQGIVNMNLDFLPLKSYSNILEGNALRLDWHSIVSPDDLDYIMGNPPFVGARQMEAGGEQKRDVALVFDGWKNFGNLDYVCCWYKKAADYIHGTSIHCAFVSTNSVTQGDSVGILWKPLFAGGIQIDFAHRSFIWDSESNQKAHVHCVIVGFSEVGRLQKVIYIDNQPKKVANINAYLVEAENVFVESRNKPLCNTPIIGIGNKPIDGGFYLFTKEEMEVFVKKEPKSKAYFKPWYGSKEFIHRKPRYCLWLGDCPPNVIVKMPHCFERVKSVREYRLQSPSAGTRKLAEKPTRFHVENMP
ncbi:DNA methyltransferase, partial [Anaerovibrio sp.]|uniref:DNA methyltransferase n=1 Tax=Anaerovibrio sp. TaxID=1872532 RepID=UPI00261C16A0